jgi:hypothetical protein
MGLSFFGSKKGRGDSGFRGLKKQESRGLCLPAAFCSVGWNPSADHGQTGGVKIIKPKIKKSVCKSGEHRVFLKLCWVKSQKNAFFELKYSIKKGLSTSFLGWRGEIPPLNIAQKEEE